ncbi:methionyl-tRNA formyltransferase [Polynucleobacter sp. IMCC30063]|uniref:methionyl-tRNA formyltransferase n=1 Tax=unclassified Polynucleobacter TaxID=2640945 RepID=UPI001F3EB7F3|nr:MULTISPECIES: methionyl-tRNA formyltransferase [unclassified Polynucleobacter]MCE7506789.1 methionyl-tRNA formyltransferase [Polynucleobacter sp. IMCC30063]MCE7528134.1 methionyl-tRNA formyltransferase [Polynucleobacter sp. IMCC 30228]MCE7529973.1 methionyl-tRNA formyltransferase [Polynucleobacter sp. IMCC 29146]
MRIALIGSQDFGKAALEAFLKRGDEVVAVFCPPDNPKSSKPEVLKEAVVALGLKPLQFASLKSPEAAQALADSKAEIGVMAYVLQFVPQDFVHIPKFGMIQYHPSLLPRYRGPSAINWAIALGETKTGLTIFRPSDGLDEGAVILQKEVAIGPDDTLGKVYFERLFPLGVAALMEAADLVVAGKHHEHIQDESQANYEGWFDQAATRIHWTSHLQGVYDLIRAANPAPGAWTTFGGEKIAIFDAAKQVARTFSAVRGKPGVVTEISAQSIFIACHGGEIEVLKAKSSKVANGSKVSGAELAAGLGLQLGQSLD